LAYSTIWCHVVSSMMGR